MSILNTVGKKIDHPQSILNDAELNWEVELSQGIYAPSVYGESAYTSNRCATVRKDTNEILGIVSPDYKIVQNHELAYLAESLVRDKSTGLDVDTGGELKNGGRVFVTISSDPFDVTDNDTVLPYLLITNGHDGLFSLSGTPTARRLICENMFNMVISTGRSNGMSISIRHKGNMNDKLESLKETLNLFFSRATTLKTQAKYLSGSNVNRETLKSYFHEVYSEYIDRIPTSIETKEDERKANKAVSVISKWNDKFDEESSSLGSNMWIGYNAVTNYIDHNLSFRGPKKEENKFMSIMYGSAATKKQRILEHTLSVA